MLNLAMEIKLKLNNYVSLYKLYVEKCKLMNVAYFYFNRQIQLNKNKYQALLADNQADGRGPPVTVVRGPPC